MVSSNLVSSPQINEEKQLLLLACGHFDEKEPLARCFMENRRTDVDVSMVRQRKLNVLGCLSMMQLVDCTCTWQL
jgi:hypothetical protein